MWSLKSYNTSSIQGQNSYSVVKPKIGHTIVPNLAPPSSTVSDVGSDSTEFFYNNIRDTDKKKVKIVTGDRVI